MYWEEGKLLVYFCQLFFFLLRKNYFKSYVNGVGEICIRILFFFLYNSFKKIILS